MANKIHLAMLKKGVEVWNKWRKENPSIEPDLSKTNFIGVNLTGADLSHTYLTNAVFRKVQLSGASLIRAELIGADLTEANLSRANLLGAELLDTNLNGANLNAANLTKANLQNADCTTANFTRACLYNVDFTGANLSDADLTRVELNVVTLKNANLSRANLSLANIYEADLTDANLNEANISSARIIEVKLNGATLTNCRVFGISAWDLIGLEEAEQSNLVITPEGEAVITVDNLEIAQFIYLLLHSEKIRNVIDTITSKVVLILGRFTPDRKAILEAIRVELRKHNYLPVLFDFDKPASRDMTETVSTLAHMARFVIVDITDPQSVPQELSNIIPFLPSVPVQPILLSSAKEYAMFEHFTKYPWVLKIYRYNDIDDLLKSLGEKVITPAEEKSIELKKNCNP